MAKDKNIDANEETKEGGKAGTIFVVVLIILIWLAIFALLIKMDFAGIGSMLRPYLKDVPVISFILPDVSDEQLIYEQNYPYASMKEAVDVIKSLEKQVDELTASNEELTAKVNAQAAEIERLKVFEEDQLAFEERVKRFDIGVVYNSNAPDIEEYKKYYEEINPDTAAEIYRQVIEQLEYDEAIKEKAKLLKTMKPANAANAIQEMTADIEYTCKLLLCMKTDEATAILDKCDTLFVARVIQTMHDMDIEWYNKIQNNLLQNQPTPTPTATPTPTPVP